MREISRFLLRAKIKAPTTGAACRSIADLDRAEAERLAGERVLSEQSERAAAAARDKAEDRASLEIISARENGMALTGVALLLALASGGAAFLLAQKERKRDTGIAIALAVLMTGGAVAAWVTRPSLSDIESRADELAAAGAKKKGAPLAGNASGNLICVLDGPRSRVTVSDAGDVPLNWRADGCVNGRTQYGLSAQGWSRVLVPSNEDTVTIASFDPDTGTYRTDRYLLGIEEMAKLRAERDKLDAPACGASEEAARRLGADQSALAGLLPGTPNERMVYDCRKAD